MARPIHRDDARRIVIGTFTLLLLIGVGAVGAIVQTGGALPGRSHTYVTADFDDVGILKTGKEVKQDGLVVGIVSGIEYVEGRARVTLRLEGDVDVHQDARAYVGNASALGKKYVAFDPGTDDAGDLADDAVLPTSQTIDSTSLEDALSSLDPQTRRSLQSTLGEVAAGTAGHSDDLDAVLSRAPALLEDLQTVAGAAADPAAEIGSLLNSADRLVDRFDGRAAEIGALVENVDKTMQGLGVDDGAPLSQAIAALPTTLDTTKAALIDLYGPLGNAREALRDLKPGGQALGRATPALRRVLREGVAPLDKVPGVSDLADPAVRDLTGTLRDASPLIRPVTDSAASLRELLTPLTPYIEDVSTFFIDSNKLLAGTLRGRPDQHYFAAALTGVGLFSVDGIPDPLYRSEAYSCPGTATNHATRTDCSGRSTR